MTKFIPEDLMEQVKNTEGTNRFIKAEEMEGEGLILTCVAFKKTKANNPKFGANEKDALWQQDILKDGELFRYTFKTKEGQERLIESKSLALFLGFSAADPQEGDTVKIHKEGKMEDTRYYVEILEGGNPF